MRSFVKWFGITALVVVIGFFLAACGDVKDVKLEGTTWKLSGSDNGILTFGTPPNMTLSADRGSISGTYTVSGNKVTITMGYNTATGKVSGNTLTWSDVDDDGDVGNKMTFTKQ